MDKEQDDLLGDLMSQTEETNEVNDAAADLFADDARSGVSDDVDDPAGDDTERLHQSERERLLAKQEADRLRAERAEAEAKKALEDVDGAVTEAQAALTKARRDALSGDTDEDAAAAAETAAQKALFDAMLRREAAAAQHAQAQRSAQTSATEQNLDLIAWRERNPRYGTDKAFTAEADKIAIELEHTQGLDTRKPQFWKKLDERLNRERRMQANGRTGPGPARSPESRAAEPAAGKATKNESTLMQAIGLDPNDAEHLAELRKQHARVTNKRAA